jgi:hypothetical protein
MIRPLSALFAASLALSSADANDADFAKAISRADQAVRNENWAAALEAANAAIRQAPDHFKGHYYVGYVFYKTDNLDDAETSASSALGLAPEQSKASVHKLIDAIGKKRALFARLKAGDAAAAEGFRGKAAQEYTAAWKSFPERRDIGIRAAKLWIELGERAEAVRIAAPIARAVSSDDPCVAEAKSLLQAHDTALVELYRKVLDQGWKDHCLAQDKVRWLSENDHRVGDGFYAANETARDRLADAARNNFLSAAELIEVLEIDVWLKHEGSSGRWSPHLGLASLATLNPYSLNVPAVLKHVAAAANAKVGIVRTEINFSEAFCKTPILRWYDYTRRPEFMALLTDLWGPSAAAAAR